MIIRSKLSLFVGLILMLAACQPASSIPVFVPTVDPGLTPLSTPTPVPNLTPASPVDSGIQGTVTLGPTCPGPQRIGQVCTQPFAATLIITRPDGTEITRVTSSETDGHFRVSLPAGDYVIVPLKDPQSPLPVPRTENTPVTVQAQAYTEIEIQFDTGMR